MTHLSILKLNIQEVKVSKDSELLLWGGVICVFWFPSPVIRGYLARLVLHKIQLPTTWENHLYRTMNKEKQKKGKIVIFFKNPWLKKVQSAEFPNGQHKVYLTEGFFVSPTSCPSRDNTFTSFSRVLFCRGKENTQILWINPFNLIHIIVFCEHLTFVSVWVSYHFKI